MEPIYLKDALTSVKWDSLVSEFIEYKTQAQKIEACNTRLAIWSRQLENAEKGNPSLSFIREMQIAGHHFAALVSLALYNPAAATVRTIVETALYYTYFRTHPQELATLVRDENYYIDKQSIVNYHKQHSNNFIKYQSCFDLIGKLNSWYSKISAVIHGQIPGTWITHQALVDLKHKESDLNAIIETFEESEEIVHHLFLCTVGVELWVSFSPTSKRKLIKGLPGKTRATLGISSS